MVGEIRPPSSKNQRYILVGIDYFTKWIEVIPLPNVDQEDMIEFIHKHIIYRFGIPETVTIDQGSIFTSQKMQEFAKEMCFKLLTSTSFRPHFDPKEATNSTPFRLTSGNDAVLLVEIYVQSTRIQRRHEIPPESYWNMMLDELVDLDEERLNAL